jgi:hypothetical protein
VTTRLARALRHQAASCAELGSPFMARLCRLLAARLTPGTRLADRLFNWPGDLGPRAASVPLRLAGALHALRLLDRGGLAAVYPPMDVDDTSLWAAVSATLESEAAFIGSWIDSPPQTNEVRRSAVLIATGHWLTARCGLPLRLSELGASGGLNLHWDRFALRIDDQVLGPADPALTLQPTWQGPRPPAASPVVAERRGADLNPLDPHDPTDRLRLRAYLWADQPARLALTDAAIKVARPSVDRADAIDWLQGRLRPIPGQMHLIYHTVAWQYFRESTQRRGRVMIEAAGDTATASAPLAWFGMEADAAARGAGLTLRLWPGGHRIAMGRADFHCRWVNWTAPA